MIIEWAIFVLILIGAEMATLQLVSIWLAAGAFLSLIACAMGFPLIVQLGVFAVSSLILLVLTYPVMRKYARAKKVGTNFELAVGEFATVIEEINVKLGTGRVSLKGVDWSAVSETGEVIPADTVVIVKSVSGSKLTVEMQNVAAKIGG